MVFVTAAEETCRQAGLELKVEGSYQVSLGLDGSRQKYPGGCRQGDSTEVSLES